MREFWRTKFALEGLEDFEFTGYTAGETWNGWACPYFEFEEAIRVLEAGQKNGYAWSYRAENDAFVVRHRDDPHDYRSLIVRGQLIWIEGQEHVYYPIGAFSWSWMSAQSI